MVESYGAFKRAPSESYEQSKKVHFSLPILSHIVILFLFFCFPTSQFQLSFD